MFTDALLTFDGAIIYNDLHTSNFVSTVAAKAMFTNDSAAEDVDFVSVNETPLLKEAPGQYLPASLDYPQPYRADWIVKGYEGNNFEAASNSLSELQYTEVKAGDTVLKSSGFTIKYTGHSDGDLIVSVDFDRSTTYVFGDTLLAYTGKGSLEKTIVDNGSVSISSSELTGFTPGGYISINIEHWEYHEVYIKSGRRIGVKNRYSVSIPLFLKGHLSWLL